MNFILSLMLILVSIFGTSCALLGRKEKPKTSLLKFQHLSSSSWCKEIDNERFGSTIFTKISGKNSINRDVFSFLEKSRSEKGATHYIREKNQNESLAITYKCNFDTEILLAAAEDVKVLKSDHIPVNCDLKKETSTKFFNDDFDELFNHLKNKGHSSKGNVVNMQEFRGKILKIGIYNCSTRQLAKARIGIRKEAREEESLRARKNNTFVTQKALRSIGQSLNAMRWATYQRYIYNSN